MSEIIAANRNGFVAVTIQYRVSLVLVMSGCLTNMLQLGAFGFLSSSEIKSNGVVNAGILDMAFALAWVQKYITKFGGDPAKVTISGESAGAGGVLLLGIAKDGSLGTSLFQNVSAPNMVWYLGKLC
jgi:carboxylesterase type B